MNTEELFKLLHHYEEFNFTLWNIYIAVTLAVLGYSIGSDKIVRLPPRVLLVLAFIAFTYGNANYLERNMVLINAAATEIAQIINEEESVSVEFKKAISSWKKMQPESIRMGHHILDIIVIFLILVGPQLIHGFGKKLAKSKSDV